MSSGFIRVWKEVNIKEIQKQLIVVGELSAECFACHDLSIDAKSVQCPHCGASFKYKGFRRKVTPQYLAKVKEENPGLILIDFEDFKRSTHKSAARKLLDL